ncbi:preprotein translocase subunit SecG [Candidatus Cytomitobacter primus]|uniref:Protein-export membrane protein SecG n=1 Tax=Candidatus Cytomitobacter primus TaxID=2066024 RepID=A0A5C0UGD2_9PROT|nr:preprotein translocase subunit SecG [Candidatus Cytomitobacter primus]QEK38790.1 hypothetical protein FZC34_02655 [Candidatus Cytomitobacter primus]
MLSFIWSIYLVVVLSLSILIFLQKGEDSVSMSQSQFMTPRAMSTFLTKSTYTLYVIFISLCLIIGIMIKKEKIALNKEFSSESISENSANNTNDIADSNIEHIDNTSSGDIDKASISEIKSNSNTIGKNSDIIENTKENKSEQKQYSESSKNNSESINKEK